MSDLTSQRSEPCEGGIAPMTHDEAAAMMSRLNDDWSLSEDATEIHRDFHFKGFYKTMAFVNAVAWVANAENHHPDLEISWSETKVSITNHSAGGLTEADFELASKIDALD